MGITVILLHTLKKEDFFFYMHLKTFWNILLLETSLLGWRQKLGDDKGGK